MFSSSFFTWLCSVATDWCTAVWLWARRPSGPLVLGLSVIDFVITTASNLSDGGFDYFHYLLYYPALALFAVICPYSLSVPHARL